MSGPHRAPDRSRSTAPRDVLAIDGGPPVKATPFGTGRRFGPEEAEQLREALEQGTLFHRFGSKVRTFLERFGALHGVEHAVATSSGTAAIHVALAAAGVTIGDEVITSPITDQGTVIGILYQGAVPVFADVDPYTYGMDPASLRERVTPRTKAIVVVHLAGNPCDMDGIMRVAREHDLKVIEDCAQSYLARSRGRLVGTIGDYGCFSTNDFKHISTGDGGIVLVNAGEEAWRRATAFTDKNYGRSDHGVDRAVRLLAPNYRMTELQGAVGIAQVGKLERICAIRHRHGERLRKRLQDVPGIQPHEVRDDDRCSYWFTMFRVDEGALGVSRDRFAAALAAEGIPCRAGYVDEPLYLQPMFRERRAFAGSHFPFDLTGARYEEGLCPTAEAVVATGVHVSMSEFYGDDDVGAIATAVEKVAHHYRTR